MLGSGTPSTPVPTNNHHLRGECPCSMAGAVDVFLDPDEASETESPRQGWSAAGSGDIQAFAERFARWAPKTSRKFSKLDIEQLLRRVGNGKPEKHFRVIGFQEFPYRQTWVEREYWLEWAADISKTSVSHLAGHDGLVVLHVHYADKWNETGQKQDRHIISQINIRHTVKHEDAEPGVNAYWHKCEDLNKWRELHGEPIFEIPPAGWRWRQQRISGARWDNGFAPVIHDLLMLAEKCTCKVRALSSVQLDVSPGVRKALVIGVEEYEQPNINNLPNAVTDSVCLKDTLVQLGWSVKIVYNPGLEALMMAVDKFRQEVKHSSDACLIAFVGHGVEVLGEHFFIPADFTLKLNEPYENEVLKHSDMQRKAVAFTVIQQHLKAVRSSPTDKQVSLFVLDCCRNSISAPVGNHTRDLSHRGGEGAPTTVDGFVNSFVIYSTSKGSTAADGPAGRGGPFMGIFAEEIMVPGMIEEVMKRTRNRLLTAECQLSQDQSTLKSNFSFLPTRTVPTTAATHIAVPVVSPETEADKKLSQLPWQEVVAWFKRINIHPRVIAILEEDKVSGAQLARMGEKELMEDLEMRKLPAQRVLMREKIFETIIHATAHALSESLSNDSYLSDVDTEAATSSGDESPDGLDGWSMIAAKHPGQPKEFRDHMRGFVTELREFMSIAHEDSEAEHVDLDIGGGNSQQWTYCMLLWLQFAKDASTDEPCRTRWLACVGHGCSQDRLLQELGEWLQQPQTCHPDWSLASFSQLRCQKQHAACVFITDRNVQRQLEAFPLSRQVWTKSVVSEWFANDEPASVFLSRANRFLQRHVIEGVEVLDKVIPTHSYVAFMFATKLAAQLLFAYLEAHSISTPAASSAGATAFALHGFSAFVSSDKSSFVAPGSLQPSRTSKAVVLQGLRCLSHLALSQRDLLGPIRPLVEFVADGEVQQPGAVQCPRLGTEQQDVQLSVQSSGGPSLTEQEVQALVQVLVKHAGFVQDKGATGLPQLKGKQQSEGVPQEPVGIVDNPPDACLTVRREQTAAYDLGLDAALAKLDSVLAKQGPVHLEGLARSLELLSSKAGAVERADFDTALQLCHVDLGGEETSTIFQALNRGDLVVGCAELVQSVCPSLSKRVEVSLWGVLEKGSSEKKPEESGSNLRFLLQFSSLFLRKDSSEPGAAGATQAIVQVRNQLGPPDQVLLHNYLQDSVSQTEKCVDSATGERLDMEGHFTSLKAIEKRSLWGECDASEEATNDDLVCNINLSIMDDPVRLSGDGKIEKSCYERGEITRWMQEKGTSPKSRRRFDSWELVPAGDKKEKITAYIKTMQEELLGREQQVEGEEERQLMLHRKGYAASRAIDPRSESKMVSDDDILKDCYSGEKAFCVIGPPASGKTTTMLRIATRAAKNALADESALIPLFLRATKLASLLSESALEADQVVDFVEFYIRHAPQLQTARSVLLSLYYQGQLLVILDGLDEAGAYRSAVERSLDRLAAQYLVGGFQGNHLLVSTRTASYTESRVWLRLTKFVPLEIQPLDEAAARAIIHHRIGDDAQEEMLWRELQSVAKNNPQLLANPFLLCLVVSIFKQSGSIPSKRGELYRLSVEGMVRRCLSTSASAKTLHSEERIKVDVEQAVQFLQCLAYVCHLGESPTRDFILDDTFMVLVQDRWTNHLGHPCELVSVLKTALIDEALCGVLTRVAGGKKRFSHLTQQEFLAACHVVHCAASSSDPARQVLDTLSRFSILDPWIREVLLHCTCLLQGGAFILAKEEGMIAHSESVSPHLMRSTRLDQRFKEAAPHGEFSRFCALILAQEAGSFAYCELVKDFLAEQGALVAEATVTTQEKSTEEEEVAAMLARKFQELRNLDEVISALFHPSPDMREREITELRRFAGGGSGNVFSTERVIESLKAFVDDRTDSSLKKMTPQVRQLSSKNDFVRFARCAAILSGAQLCDQQVSERTLENMTESVLEWMQQPELYSVSVRALGTLATHGRDHIVNGLVARNLMREVQKGRDSLTARALADLKLTPTSVVHSFAQELYFNLVPRAVTQTDWWLFIREDQCKDTSIVTGILIYIAEIAHAEEADIESEEASRAHRQLLMVSALALRSSDVSREQAHALAVVARLLEICKLPSLVLVANRLQRAKVPDTMLVHKFAHLVVTFVHKQDVRKEGEQKNTEAGISDQECSAKRARDALSLFCGSVVCDDALRELEALVSCGQAPVTEIFPAKATDISTKSHGEVGCLVTGDTLRAWDAALKFENYSSKEVSLLWDLCFEGARVEDAQFESPDMFAFLNLCFGNPEPLELNTEEWAEFVAVDCLRLPRIGRFLFSSLLRHIAAVFAADPQLAPKQLQPLAAALQRGDAVQDDLLPDSMLARQIRLETRKLLKELQVGPRCDVLPLWEGQVSGPIHPITRNTNPGLRGLWSKLQVDGCSFPSGNIVCATVYPSIKEHTYCKPDFVSDRIRVYLVKHGAEMCVSIKNFMTKNFTVEIVFFDSDGRESSEGAQVIGKLGQSKLTLRTTLYDGESQNALQVRDGTGAVGLTIVFRVSSASGSLPTEAGNPAVNHPNPQWEEIVRRVDSLIQQTEAHEPSPVQGLVDNDSDSIELSDDDEQRRMLPSIADDLEPPTDSEAPTR